MADTPLQAGDWRVPTLQVGPYAGDTAVVLRVVSPLGAVTLPSLTGADDSPSAGVRTYTAPAYELTSPGEWIEKWKVTGTGAGAETASVLVAPDPEDTAGAGRVYATSADYARWIDAAPPSGIRRALARASQTIDQLLRTAVYSVGTDDLPTDPAVAAALRDATCAQVEYSRSIMDAYGVGHLGALTSVSIGSVSIGRGSSGGGGSGSSAPAPISPRAQAILAGAGLVSGLVWTF